MPQNFAVAPTAPVVLRGIKHSLLCAALTAGAADWLLYGQPAGISVALLLGITAILVTIVNTAPLTGRKWLTAIAILSAALLPIVENLNLLSLFCGITGLCAYTLLVTDRLPVGIAEGLRQASRLVFGGPLRFLVDLTRASALLKRSNASLFGRGKLVTWINPLSLGSVFLLLFSTANPLIENWISGIEFTAAAEMVDQIRVLFWLVAMTLAWPFMLVRLGGKKRLPKEAATSLAEPALEGVAEQFLGADAVLYSLILFNGLFAVQTAIDIVYLWGGASLPAGMTFADYAHRGAYTLIFAALIAAAFVLFVLKPGGGMERSPLLRGLVLLWVGQNVFLVMSAMLRLNLYVEAYSLTYLRIAALIWMLLVAAGLILIIARIALQRTNTWLITMNAAALAGTLYVCSFVNFPNAVAAYNIAHSYQISGSGVVLDTAYLCRLGPHAIPAIEKHFASGDFSRPALRKHMEDCAAHQARGHRMRLKHWRAWSFRDWRLVRYLDKHSRW